MILVFLLVALSVYLVLTGIYHLVTARKRRLETVILGEKKTEKKTVSIHMGFWIKQILLVALCFAGGWFLVGGPIWGIFFMLIGLLLPVFTRKDRAQQQLKILEQQLEDALYRGTNVLRGGGGLYQFIEYLASDKIEEPLRSVFLKADIAIKELGIPPIEALKKIASEYKELTDLNAMTMALEEAQKNGSSLSDVVEMFAMDVRNRRMYQKEVDAKTTQGKMTATFLLSLGVCVPALLKLFSLFTHNPTWGNTTNFGIQVMTAICYVLMIIGYFVIRRMIQV